MSKIRSVNTKPELMVRQFLYSQGFRYGLHNKKLPGKPDVVLKKYKKVIFINGCFWHSHEGCRYFTMPKSNEVFREEKLYKNKINDLKNKSLLEAQGWGVIIIWECDLRKDKLQDTLNNLVKSII